MKSTPIKPVPSRTNHLRTQPISVRSVTSDDSGFTLIELLVVMLLLSILSTMVMGTYIILNKQAVASQFRVKNMLDTSHAMTVLTQDLRGAIRPPHDYSLNHSPFIKAEKQELWFYTASGTTIGEKPVLTAYKLETMHDWKTTISPSTASAFDETYDNTFVLVKYDVQGKGAHDERTTVNPQPIAFGLQDNDLFTFYKASSVAGCGERITQFDSPYLTPKYSAIDYIVVDIGINRVQGSMPDVDARLVQLVRLQESSVGEHTQIVTNPAAYTCWDNIEQINYSAK